MMPTTINGYVLEPGAQLENADLSGQDLRSIDLTGANLRGANLSGANLVGVNFTNVDLTDAWMYQAITTPDQLTTDQWASVSVKIPTPTIDLNDNDGMLVAFEIMNWEGLSGRAFPLTTVTLRSTYAVTNTTLTLTTTANEAGVWFIDQEDVGDIPPDGRFHLSVTAEDNAGLISDPALAELIFQLGADGLDFPAPTIAINDRDGVVNSDEYANWQGLTGTAGANATVILVSTEIQSGRSGTLITKADGNGDWAIRPNAGDQIPLGAFDIQVTYTDDIGAISKAETGYIRFALAQDTLQTHHLSGSIYHWNDSTVMFDGSVSVTALGNIAEQKIADSSLASGTFSMMDMQPGRYKLDVFSDAANVDEKVITSSDALTALKMSVGLIENPTAHQLIAADVNKNGRVNSADALAILKMAVGHKDALDKEFVFVDADADWQGMSTRDAHYTTGILVDSLDADRSDLDFVGILLGDVNGTYVNLVPSKDNETKWNEANNARIQATFDVDDLGPELEIFAQTAEKLGADLEQLGQELSPLQAIWDRLDAYQGDLETLITFDSRHVYLQNGDDKITLDFDENFQITSLNQIVQMVEDWEQNGLDSGSYFANIGAFKGLSASIADQEIARLSLTNDGFSFTTTNPNQSDIGSINLLGDFSGSISEIMEVAGLIYRLDVALTDGTTAQTSTSLATSLAQGLDQIATLEGFSILDDQGQTRFGLLEDPIASMLTITLGTHELRIQADTDFDLSAYQQDFIRELVAEEPSADFADALFNDFLGANMSLDVTLKTLASNNQAENNLVHISMPDVPDIYAEIEQSGGSFEQAIGREILGQKGTTNFAYDSNGMIVFKFEDANLEEDIFKQIWQEAGNSQDPPPDIRNSVIETIATYGLDGQHSFSQTMTNNWYGTIYETTTQVDHSLFGLVSEEWGSSYPIDIA